MSAEISSPRSAKKSNQPVLKSYPVSIDQRAKFLGVGGINLKRIFAKTGLLEKFCCCCYLVYCNLIHSFHFKGVTISTQDETTFSLFAPNENAYKEAEEMIKGYLQQSVRLNRHFF